MSRLRVVVLFGGRSVEREVSRISARTIAGALDPSRYDVLPLAVGPDGRFLPASESRRLLTAGPVPDKFRRPGAGEDTAESGAIVPAEITPARADVVIPIIHGTTGEDGILQGFLDFLGIPYVGAGVAGSAIGMDKAVFKALLRDAGIPTTRFLSLSPRERAEVRGTISSVSPEFRLPVFIKPSNGGSSVGVTKVKRWEDLDAALEVAFRYDDRALVEEGVDARELECAVLGNDDPSASGVGEVVPGREFYDYDDKYREDNAKLLIPAPIEPAVAEEVRRLAVRAFQVAGLSGMARVDFFLEKGTGRVLVNEVNTLPGFTAISMYPKLWEASGLPLPRLLDELIRLALERKERRDRLSHEPPAELA
ncbi:MAG TPA: D-alanine--D-alanine ligase family protein [Thermoanaerobaculia bacterium]|nr:D-alanine--D-alanine ligase family protein [Thermoanaerobaculia bacterium]